MKHRPLWAYLAAVTLLPAVPLLTLIWLSLRQGIEIAHENMERTTAALTASTTNHLSRYFREELRRMERLLALPELKAEGALDRAALSSLFERVLASQPSIDNLALINDPAGVLASRPVGLADEISIPEDQRLPADFGIDEVHDSLGFNQALYFKKPDISDAFRGPLKGRWIVVVGAPLHRGGRQEGSLVASYVLTRLSNELLSDAVTPTTSITILDSSGRTILHAPQPDKYLGQLHPSAEGIMAAARGGGHYVGLGLDGQSRYFHAAPIPGTRFIAVSAVWTEEATAAARATLQRHSIAAGIVLVLSLAVSYYIGRRLTQPRQELAASLRNHRTGALVPTPSGASKETAQLVDALNTLIRANERHLGAIRELSAQQQAIFQFAPLGIAVTNAAGTLTVLNPAAEKLLGVSEPQAGDCSNIAKFFSTATPPEGGAEPEGEMDFQKLLACAKPQAGYCERALRRQDGTLAHVALVLCPIGADAATPPSYFALIWDVTFRRRAEEERITMIKRAEQSARLESMGMLAGGVAHDFNNMLTGMMMFLELARMDAPEGSPVKSHLAQAMASALRARDLCAHMLSYAGRGRHKKGAVDMHLLARETIALVAASHKLVRFKTEFAAANATTLGDSVELRQVVMNLLINACEAMNGKPGNITLRTRLTPEAGEAAAQRLLLEVQDDGCGMPPEVKARIFEPFFTTKETGTGIGLSSSASILSEHGCRVEVDSAVGAGTTFRIFMRIAQPDTPGAQAGWPGARKALVVDDDPLVRGAVAAILGTRGLKAEVCADGQAAIDLATTGGYDLIFLDITLPDIDGCEVLRSLRAAGVRTPVIFMTGLANHPALQTVARTDYASLLLKPAGAATILEAARAALA